MAITSQELSYVTRRGQLENYFDRTAAQAWSRLTSDAPVSRIRATVRAGRDRMRSTLLSWLPEDLYGRRILDAGCGTGASGSLVFCSTIRTGNCGGRWNMIHAASNVAVARIAAAVARS